MSEVQPDAVSFNSVIGANARGLQWQLALQWLESMQIASSLPI